MMKRSFLVFGIASLLIIGCVKNQLPAKRIELNGINGKAHYYFSRKNGKVINVMKDEYTNHPAEYSLSINKDTLTLGEEFIASFAVFNPKFKVVITEPRSEMIEGSYDFKLRPEAMGFKYTADREGLFNLTGQLEYDSTVVPFEFKFLVVDKKD